MKELTKLCSASRAVGPRRRRAQWPVYSRWLPKLSTPNRQKIVAADSRTITRRIRLRHSGFRSVRIVESAARCEQARKFFASHGDKRCDALIIDMLHHPAHVVRPSLKARGSARDRGHALRVIAEFIVAYMRDQAHGPALSARIVLLCSPLYGPAVRADDVAPYERPVLLHRALSVAAAFRCNAELVRTPTARHVYVPSRR